MQEAASVKSDASLERELLIAAGRNGDADAQSRLGDVYRVGDELTKQDYAEALRWYRSAAEQGDAHAQNNLGAMYQHAMGTPNDMAEAALWYRRASEQGFTIAQYNLAICLLHGWGVPQNMGEAAEWLHAAAQQGDIDAIAELGDYYLYAQGRIPIAAEHHVIAALEGHPEAAARLAKYREELERMALSGSMLSALCLAKMFDRGLGVEESKPMMLAWLRFGERYGTRDNDPDVRDELTEMREFYSMVLSDADKDEAHAVFKGLKARCRNATRGGH